MNPRQKKMTLFIGIAVVAAALVAWLVVTALNKDGGINFSITPSAVYNKQAPQGRSFRIGGMVVENSVKRDSGGLTVHFELTDKVCNVPVLFTGPLPDLFKEGKGAVAQGRLEADGTFHADEVLAKHDENYMPPEAKQALDQAKASASAQCPAPEHAFLAPKLK